MLEGHFLRIGIQSRSDGGRTGGPDLSSLNHNIIFIIPSIQVSNLPSFDYPGYRTPYYEVADHTVLLARPSTPHTKTSSSLEVKKKNNPLPCDQEEDFSIQYTVVGEAPGSVEVVYLVSGISPTGSFTETTGV